MATVPTHEFYDEVGLEYEKGFAHNPGLRDIVDNFLARLPKSALVLDCGSGTGKPVSEMIVNSGRRVVAIDFSKTMHQVCFVDMIDATD